MLLQLALGAALLAAPQVPVRVDASLSASRINTGETTILLLTVETDGAAPAEIPVPLLPRGLELGPISDFSQLQLAFPGGRRRVTRREIVLLAREPGRYRIPSVTVDVAGAAHASPALELTVLPGTAAPAPAGGAEVVQLRAWAEPDTVYAGEQLLYQAEALFPEELRLRQARAPVFEPPAATGFWVFDLPDAVSISLRIVGGAAYEVQNFRQVLFPLAPGEFQLPAARMLYEVRQGIVFTPDRREVRSNPVQVNVRPLPPGAPAEFAGAVGRYRVRAEVSPARVAPGEPATLRFIVEGAGNVKALPRPELAVVAGAEVYAGPERVDFGFADGRVSGRKVMEWTIVPRERGVVTIPALAYSWFDPGAGAYQSMRTEVLRLDATSVAASAGDSALAPLRLEPAVARLAWTRSPLFAAAQLLPPLLLLALALARRLRRQRRQARGETADDDLRRAARLRHDPRACLEATAQFVRRHDSAEAEALLARIRAALYAPEPPGEAECTQLLDAARRLRGGRRAPAHGWPLLLVALLTLPLQQGPAAFQGGVEAFAAGEYDVASRRFAEHLRGQPRDAAAWYNLGNAWSAAEAPGRAAWAWVRALELRPRDAWARRNLRYAGAQHALEALAPAVRLATEEVALGAAALWWVAVFAGAAAWRRRRRAPTLAAAVALLLLLPALGLLAARALAPERAVTLAPAVLRAAPVQRADPLARLAPAQPVVVLERRGEWLLARSRDLREGWLERTSVGGL